MKEMSKKVKEYSSEFKLKLVMELLKEESIQTGLFY